MLTDEFNYQLPLGSIAQHPITPRDMSRMLVLNRGDGTRSHRVFRDLPEYLGPGDVLVVNDTQVLPARLYGRRPLGGKTEVLLLREIGPDEWECLVKPGAKTRVGDSFAVLDHDGNPSSSGLVGHVTKNTSFGGRAIKWSYVGTWKDALDEAGWVPLPPYITAPLHDPSRYQTVYAKTPGSAAAPTAGLHFTPELLGTLRAKGVVIVSITLDVGLDTFRPVKSAKVRDHVMHKETIEVTQDVADTVNEAHQKGHRVCAVGTTVARTLESVADHRGIVRPYKGMTSLFIYPGYKPKVVDHLITNFHLPKSSLLMLVSAFAGRDLVMDTYKEAVALGYRFFSFGDAMLVL